ncbi:hypothetical protein K431DRAFT_284219 [Polychaeton citri CBS 116435]|uniref:SH3 domain-containing protein n=1 Tax=Polychaeton citri CBS 116435 TaxID=1314669 RepID=A0A9P4UR70_9PEZI|nr:hypothetical protein K431DRAFT_284219 [Polychaeton citri CBS 116435]
MRWDVTLANHTLSTVLQLMKDLKLYRNQWEEILNNQFTFALALFELYKPVDPAQYPEQRHQPSETPQRIIQRSQILQKEYADLRNDLNTELDLINTRLIQPVEHAKVQIKPIHKTIKHRENMKLDYERYLSRAEHVRQKESRSVKDETALATHESNLAQARIDYETADEQVRATLPPISAAVLSMLPLIATSQVMVTTTLVGQTYTVLEAFCRRVGFPSPAPSDDMIIADWDRDFSGFRNEVESGLKVLASGKAVQQSMTLQEKSNSVTGFGIRDKIANKKIGNPMGGGNGSQRPMIASGRSSSQNLKALPAPSASDQASTYSASNYGGDDEEAPPVKPPRPGVGSGNGYGGSNYGGSNVGSPPPQINLNNKPQIPSQSKPRTPSVGSNTALVHRGSFNNQHQIPPQPIPSPASLRPSRATTPGGLYQGNNNNGYATGGGATPPSVYGTPLNSLSPHSSYPTSPGPGYGLTPTQSNQSYGGSDYFGANQRRPSQASLASSAASIAAGKKKPPPPPAPKPKRLGSQQEQFVIAVYDYDAQGAGDLGFREGDRIKVVKKTGSQDDWWEGEFRGMRGSFPANYVKKDGWS